MTDVFRILLIPFILLLMAGLLVAWCCLSIVHQVPFYKKVA